MIYLDNSATTVTDSDAAKAALVQMTQQFGNPSSLHHFGMQAYQTLMNARYQLARSLSAPTSRVFFTSGGTMSNNLALRGVAASHAMRGHMVTTAIEHSSVLACAAALESSGVEVTRVMPNPVTHRIEVPDVIHALRPDTILVSVMHTNNETGEILPVREISRQVRAYNPEIQIHCDAVQSFGKLDVSLHKLEVDLLSASAHKIHGPKGIGLLYVREGCALTPLIYGGKQEGGLNPGTENVPLACAFGLAAEKRLLNFSHNTKIVQQLNTYLRTTLMQTFPGALMNSPEDASPYILNFSLPGYEASALVDALSMKDIYISAGAACSKGAPSHVLKNAGYDSARVSSALRISFCEDNTVSEIDTLLCTLKSIM